MSPMKWSVSLLLLALAACSELPPPAVAPACPTVVAPAIATSEPRPCDPCQAPASTTTTTTTADPYERFYPGGDTARTKPRKRQRTAVLLFAPPRTEPTEGLARIEPLRFLPIACAIQGKLETGARCGEVMPAKATVRLTAAPSGDDTLEVARRTTTFTANAEDGPVTFPAPYAAACCMYKRCDGKTIPYRPAESQGAVLSTDKTILAVWPEDAEIDLEPMTAETDDAAKHTWKIDRAGPRKLLQLATSDLDGDGRRESIVYERWANDYGLDFFANGSATPLYRFGCGNI